MPPWLAGDQRCNPERAKAFIPERIHQAGEYFNEVGRRVSEAVRHAAQTSSSLGSAARRRRPFAQPQWEMFRGGRRLPHRPSEAIISPSSPRELLGGNGTATSCIDGSGETTPMTTATSALPGQWVGGGRRAAGRS